MSDLYYEITEPVRAWRYDGSPIPAWAEDRVRFQRNGLLVHDRQSGRQIVNLGEWLVCTLDGVVVFYTNDEFEQKYRKG